MRSRGVVVAVALVFAVLAATGVAMYLNGVRADARTGGGTESVLFATRDVSVGTGADELIDRGAFELRSIRKDQVVRGAITDVEEIRGLRTTSPILEGEQVSAARFEGSDAQLGGGSLGLPPGYQAISLSLDSARAAGGAIQPGDHVTVYATFSTRPVEGVGREITVTLVPDAEVVAIRGAAVGQTAAPQSTVTLALKPAKAQRVVFAQERGSVWLGLLAPNETGQPQGAVGFEEATE